MFSIFIMNVKIITHDSFDDQRGSYWTLWHNKEHKKIEFKHDKVSYSKKNVLRGYHGDKKTWKLVTCLYGSVHLSVVNYKKRSKSFLLEKNFVLTRENKISVLIPPYYLNAYLCLSKECIFHYKFSYDGEYLDVDDQFSLKWNDKRINKKWGIKSPILSKRDS